MQYVPAFMLTIVATAACTTLATALSQSPQRSDSDVPRIYRVILPVMDIDRAAAFYAELLGIEGERVSPGRHYFQTGGVILAVMDPRADGDEREARPNQDHVYFAVKQLEAFHARATQLGGLAEEMGSIAERPWGEVSFYAQDPSGNPLCFVDETTLFTGG